MIKKSTIDEITKVIVEDYQPEKIVLFGSYAKGKASNDSDLDMFVIADKEKELPRRRKRGLALLFKLRKYHFSKDILFYTQEEIEEWKSVKSAFITKNLNEGVILYEK